MRLKINHKVVWVLVALQMLLTVLWHYLLTQHEPASLSLNPADFRLSQAGAYLLAIAGIIAQTYTLAYLFSALQIQTIPTGLLFAFSLWLGLHFQEMLIIDIFRHAALASLLLNAGKSLLNFLLAGAVLGGWRKYKEPVLIKGYGYPGD